MVGFEGGAEENANGLELLVTLVLVFGCFFSWSFTVQKSEILAAGLAPSALVSARFPVAGANRQSSAKVWKRLLRLSEVLHHFVLHRQCLEVPRTQFQWHGIQEAVAALPFAKA